MKAPRTANTDRLNCQIRADVKEALKALAARRNDMEGGYVGLARVINEAALMLLRREGINAADYRVDAAPKGKPVKPAGRQKRMEAAQA